MVEKNDEATRCCGPTVEVSAHERKSGAWGDEKSLIRGPPRRRPGVSPRCPVSRGAGSPFRGARSPGGWSRRPGRITEPGRSSRPVIGRTTGARITLRGHRLHGLPRRAPLTRHDPHQPLTAPALARRGRVDAGAGPEGDQGEKREPGHHHDPPPAGEPYRRGAPSNAPGLPRAPGLSHPLIPSLTPGLPRVPGPPAPARTPSPRRRRDRLHDAPHLLDPAEHTSRKGR